MTVSNIKNGNYTETIFQEEHPNQRIFYLDVQDDLIAAWSPVRITLWDQRTVTSLWTIGDNNADWKAIKIVDDCLVRTGSTSIDILDIKNGDIKASIACGESKDLTSRKAPLDRVTCGECKVSIIDKQIFTLNKGLIKEWDLQGKSVREMESMESSEIFLGRGKFLVTIFKKTIMAHNLENNTKAEYGADFDVEVVSIEGSRLVCGGNPFQYSIIDLESSTTTKFTFSSWAGKISNILLNQEKVFLVETNKCESTVMAHDLSNQSLKVMGKHYSHVVNLAIDGSVLISNDHSHPEACHMATLRFWDAEKLEELMTSTKFLWLRDIAISKGKFFTTEESAVVKWDYNVEHEGKKMGEGSAKKVHIHEATCSVQ